MVLTWSDLTSPDYDSGEITAVAASAIMYEMLTLVALKKRREQEIAISQNLT